MCNQPKFSAWCIMCEEWGYYVCSACPCTNTLEDEELRKFFNFKKEW
jgi:hypothetical protein